MNAYFFLTLTSLILFIIYTIIVVKLFGIPSSYSDTFYLFKNKKKGLCLLFPLLNVFIIFMVLPGWLTTSDKILPNLTFLSFISAAGLLFVAASPLFKQEEKECGSALKNLIYRSFHGQGLVHTIGALLAMIGSVIWLSFTCVWIILPILLVITLIIGLATKTLIKSIVFWIEIFIYMSIFIGLLVINIMLYF